MNTACYFSLSKFFTCPLHLHLLEFFHLCSTPPAISLTYQEGSEKGHLLLILHSWEALSYYAMLITKIHLQFTYLPTQSYRVRFSPGQNGLTLEFSGTNLCYLRVWSGEFKLCGRLNWSWLFQMDFPLLTMPCLWHFTQGCPQGRVNSNCKSSFAPNMSLLHALNTSVAVLLRQTGFFG